MHGGICALLLDQLLGEVATDQMSLPKFTGTISLRYLRGTPLGPLRAEAWVERTEGHKTYARGFLADAQGPTVEAEGCSSCRLGRAMAGRAKRLGGGGGMKFYVSCAFSKTSEVVEIAKAADDLGYEGLGIPDHVVNLETLATPYPYTPDGERRWQPFTDWPDPWVLVGALAQATQRLKFLTTVYIPAMRDPYSAAKAIGTAAYLADGRVELGIGVGWCEEEFTLMGQQFAKRGKRTDEMIELMRRLGSQAGPSSTASSTRPRGWR